MKKVKCNNGHIFDADRFMTCPACAADSIGQVTLPEKKIAKDAPVTQPLHPTWEQQENVRKVQCCNGHFFDAGRFSKCPICGAETESSKTEPIEFDWEPDCPDLDGKPMSWHMVPKQTEKIQIKEAPVTQPLRFVGEQQKGVRKVKCSNGHFFDAGRFLKCPLCSAAPIESLGAPDKEALDPSGSKTERICIFPDPTDVDDSFGGEHPPEQKSKLNDGDGPTQSGTQTESISEKGSLADAVEATASKKTTALPTTTAFYDAGEVEPPVGWLICIQGVYTGRAFECKVGRNRIGRNLDMDICLSEDTSISRDVHAVIIYEPRTRIFYVQNGTSRGLTYYNGKSILDHEELHAYDRVELGKSEFLFLPLCGEKFTWDDYMEKG